jgi:hypothetical protein
MEYLRRIALESKKAYFVLINQAMIYFLINNGTFSFDVSLRAGNHSWGFNPDAFPIFTGFIFGYHKFAWFHLTGCFVLRSLNGELSIVGNRVFRLQVYKALLSIWTFLVVFYMYPVNIMSVFLWSFSECLTLMISHTVVLKIEKWNGKKIEGDDKRADWDKYSK